MVVFDNLAHILRATLLSTDPDQNYNEWKVLGEEFSGRIIVGWVIKEASETNLTQTQTCVGAFLPKTNQLKVLFRYYGRINIIQASADKDFGVLSYVARSENTYSHFLVPIQEDPPQPMSLGIQRDYQIMTTFLDSLKSTRLLVMIHTESILLYHLEIEDNVISTVKSEPMTKSFSWAQWDYSTQSLYFIHFRKSIAFEENEEKQEIAPTLSCLQFHTDLPHETVLNIPLNLPSLSQESSSSIYEDDCVPLRVRDCALDLLIVSDKRGIVCICHHYLYQPVKPPRNDSSSPTDDSATVHFAYSVTLLHHGCVVHCALPSVRWLDAKTLRPGFTLLGSQYLLIHGPNVFTHLLDIGLAHEPFCHMLLPKDLPAVPKGARLVTLKGEFAEAMPMNEALTPVIMLDLITLDLLEVDVSYQDLINGFQQSTSDLNRLAILHYFLVHANDLDLVEEILSILSLTPHDISVTKFLQEVLVGGAYSIAQRNLPSDASKLISLLPMTCIYPSPKTDIVVDHKTVSLNHEILWNTAMMLLSPQQRLVPYRSDIWTKLWDQLAKLTETPRFKHSQVAEKLLVSLVCYQPEVLSRCSTPMSPAAGFVPTCALIDISGLNQSSNRKAVSYELPFLEIDSCTASKQEHIISVNTREVNMYLMKNSIREAPMHVHAVSARYVTAQLDMSKQLCHILSRIAGVVDRPDKGFSLIRNLDNPAALLLFILFQRFHHAAEQLAYPLPQGLSSFFCYLGYNVLPYHLFLQYLNSNVFQLQVDVMKEILNDTEDDKEGAEKKVRLLQALPRSRAKRLLNTWSHPVSLMLRAREHALNILSGVQVARIRHAHSRRHVHASRGLAAFPTGDRISPLDTFLDLLTAKANLTELDFTLLIEATVSSTEEFL